MKIKNKLNEHVQRAQQNKFRVELKPEKWKALSKSSLNSLKFRNQETGRIKEN